MNHKLLPVALSFSIFMTQNTPAWAAETPPAVTFGGFIDTYYAYDLNRPSDQNRSFTTQPARHNEFNVNLAFIEAKINRDRIRGRLALQAGTSVQSNYASEPKDIGGPNLARFLQEAYAGYRLSDSTWIDAGIFLSHIGLESFISRDNLTYTRSLVADYSPYYETGIKLSTQFNDQFSGQLLILNGWQNIAETNPAKAIGTQLSYSLNPETSITYNTFFGKESGALRHFHDFVLKYSPNAHWTFAGEFDFGFQGDSSWNGLAVFAKRSMSQTWSVVARVEQYSDPQQVLIAKSNGSAFKTWGASLGTDTQLDEKCFWRNEVRGFTSNNAIFPGDLGFQKTSGVIVSSISVGF